MHLALLCRTCIYMGIMTIGIISAAALDVCAYIYITFLLQGPLNSSMWLMVSPFIQKENVYNIFMFLLFPIIFREVNGSHF